MPGDLKVNEYTRKIYSLFRKGEITVYPVIKFSLKYTGKHINMLKEYTVRGVFDMYCLLSSSWIFTWGTIKPNTYPYMVIQYLPKGV